MAGQAKRPLAKMDLVTGKPDELALAVQDYMGKQFKYPAHIIYLFELAQKSGDPESLRKLMFTAKYVNGLKRVVSSGSYTEDKYLEKLFEEFNQNVQKMLNIIDEMLEDSDDARSREVRSSYLKMDHESLARSLQLAEDLSLCKEYFNRNEK
jgi:hypothetical protein